MPPKPRASSRLRSVPLDANGAEKPLSRKRAASVAVAPEDQQLPRKRGRPAKDAPSKNLKPINENIPEEAPTKAATRGRGRPPKTPQVPAATKVMARGSRTIAINPLPQPRSHPRPPRLCFIFGNGDFGQFGLGTETLGEIPRPRLHAWFETAAKGDVLGSQGAGIEKVSAGGMHTLAIDETGKVS